MKVMEMCINRSLSYRNNTLKLMEHSRKTLLCLYLLYSSVFVFGQCQISVTHTVGAKIIGCTKVSVSSTGLVDTMSTYCATTKPYLIGHKRSGIVSADGSYIFNFSPPVNSLTLNFSGMSEGFGAKEEIILKVNNLHYKIPNAGMPNGCDPLALLTSAGNIAPCNGCGGSGWSGTTISGSISSLTVLDTVLSGNPAGTIFSLFICENPNIDTIGETNDTLLCNGQALLLNANANGATYLWQDNSTNPTFSTSQAGTFWVETDINNCKKTDTIHVEIQDCDFDIPNVFTPNEDEVNDHWFFEAKNATNVNYCIYNRWGNLIKCSDIKSHTFIEWDGRTTTGEACSAGIYFYVLTYTDAKGEDQKKNGHITLIK